MFSKLRTLVPYAAVAAALLACQLPGMIPLSVASQPDMETDAESVIETLNGRDWVALQGLVEEQYSEDEYSKPGTLTYTAEVTNEVPVYFSYGWCTVDEATLQQNFEHITVSLSFDGSELGDSVVHPITFVEPGGLVCVDFGVLLSNWQPGEYELKAVATFDEVINDGLADYNAGDYVFVYNVTVSE